MKITVHPQGTNEIVLLKNPKVIILPFGYLKEISVHPLFSQFYFTNISMPLFQTPFFFYFRQENDI